jgi:hypothetical protein
MNHLNLLKPVDPGGVAVSVLPALRVLGFVVTALLASSGLAGCGGPAKPKTVPVSGTVTSGDKPVTDARIRFIPDDPNGRTAFGDLDAEGKFTLTTSEKGDGVIPGSYKVDVTPQGSGAPSADIKEKTAVPKAAFPDKYRDTKKSGLTFNLKGGETLDIKLD